MVSIFQGRFIPHVVLKYDLAHVAGWDPYKICMIWHMLGWICTMQILHNLSTAGEGLDDLDHDLSDLSITR